MPAMIPAPESPPLITGLVLAGGAGRRMGGADKGLLEYRGETLAALAARRLAPQVDRLLISANRNLERYRQFGHPLVSDRTSDLPGPLGGVQAGLAACAGDWLVTVPCDSPAFPEDLAARLLAAAEAARAPAAWAITAAASHPVFMLCHRLLLADLDSALAAGERRVGGWLQRVGAIPVSFPDEAAFANFNTPADLA